MHLVETVESIAARQHSLISRDQLREAGHSDDEIRRLSRQRLLVRVRPRVYAVVGVRETWERGLHAVLLSAGEPAFASHSAAAHLWEFAPSPERWFEVTVPRERFLEMEGVRFHRSLHVEPADSTHRTGIPCTSFERTLCDCTALLSEFQLARALDNGLRRGVASLARLQDCAERLESGPYRHMSSIRALLADRDATYDAGGSEAELRILRVLRQARLPLPVQQHDVNVDGQTYRPDYAWPSEKIFAEYYGLPDHIGATAVAYDSERVTALASDGWLPLIFTMASTDRQIIQRTIAAFAQRRDGRVLGS